MIKKAAENIYASRSKIEVFLNVGCIEDLGGKTMPITPEQAERLSEEDAGLMIQLEHEIDQRILEAYRTREKSHIREYGINVTVPVGTTPRLVAKLEGMYNEFGWYMEYHENQRDGEWLKLMPKSL